MLSSFVRLQGRAFQAFQTVAVSRHVRAVEETHLATSMILSQASSNLFRHDGSLHHPLVIGRLRDGRPSRITQVGIWGEANQRRVSPENGA